MDNAHKINVPETNNSAVTVRLHGENSYEGQGEGKTVVEQTVETKSEGTLAAVETGEKGQALQTIGYYMQNAPTDLQIIESADKKDETSVGTHETAMAMDAGKNPIKGVGTPRANNGKPKDDEVLNADNLEYIETIVIDSAQSEEASMETDVDTFTEPAGLHKEPIIIQSIEQISPATASSDKMVADINSIHTINTSASSGLSLLAQYGSDSDSSGSSEDEDNSSDADESSTATDTESVIEVPTTSSLNYRSKVIEIESDTDSDSTSTDSDAEADAAALAKMRKNIEETITMGSSTDDDEADNANGENKIGKHQPPKVRGEMLLDELPPIQDLHITVPEEECIELGRVQSIVDQLVLVNVLPKSVLLDLGTVLFLDKGKRPLGEVFDVLGQVADPIYCVRFNSNQQIKDKNICIGDVVYVAPKTQYTQFIILSSLTKQRGSDASWENDVEPPPRYLDYSDDEQERDARAQRRNRDRPNYHEDPAKRTKAENVSDDERPGTSTSVRQYNVGPTRGYHRGGRRGGATSNASLLDNNQFQASYSTSPNQPYNSNSHYSSSWHSNYYPPRRAPAPGPVYYCRADNMFNAPPPFNPYVPPPMRMQMPPRPPPMYGMPPPLNSYPGPRPSPPPYAPQQGYLPPLIGPRAPPPPPGSE